MLHKKRNNFIKIKSFLVHFFLFLFFLLDVVVVMLDQLFHPSPHPLHSSYPPSRHICLVPNTSALVSVGSSLGVGYPLALGLVDGIC